MEIVSYSQARKTGRLRYFTGKPCLAGHISERYARTGTCVECHLARAARYTEKNAAKRQATGKKYFSKNREKVLEKQAEWRDENRELFNQRARNWRAKNLDKVAARAASRRILQKTATPLWVNRKDVLVEYALAAWCTKVMGRKYHVDHIVPINHPLVCGLHVPWNLQVIPATENIKKSNHFPAE